MQDDSDIKYVPELCALPHEKNRQKSASFQFGENTCVNTQVQTRDVLFILSTDFAAKHLKTRKAVESKEKNEIEAFMDMD